MGDILFHKIRKQWTRTEVTKAKQIHLTDGGPKDDSGEEFQMRAAKRLYSVARTESYDAGNRINAL